MRKATSLLLLLALNVAALTPVFTQKTRFDRKIRSIEPVQTTSFADVAGYSDGSGAWLLWSMGVEKNNLGFQVYRLEGKERELVRYGEFIKGSQPTYGDQVIHDQVYDFFDEKGSTETLYVIVAMTLGGESIESAPFYPSYVPDLKSMSGFRQRDPMSRNQTNGVLQTAAPIVEDKELRAEIESNQLVPDPVKHRTVISTSGSVKIGVRADGPTRVTKTELQNAGFNVNSDPSTWQLFLQGNEQAITIGPNADYIEFLGKGIDTVESDMRMYYLIQGVAPGLRIGTRSARPSFTTVVAPSAPQTLVKKERIFYLFQIRNGADNNYWGNPIFSSPSNFTFNLSGIDFTSPTASVTVRVQGYSLTPHNLGVTLNGQALAPVTGSHHDVLIGNYVFPTSALVEGTNTLSLQDSGTSFFDSVTVSFSRKYTALQNQLSFAAPHLKNVDLDGFSSTNIRVFDVTNENEPILVTNLVTQPTGPTFGLRVPAGRARLYYAAEDSQIRSAAFVGANDPALLTNPTPGGQFVVIAHPSLLTQAATWAAYRSGPGMVSRVVNVDEIYDEFNYGVASADSIQQFLSWASTNWTPGPQYILLMGDGSYDPRNYENRGYFNMVPSKSVDTVYTETPSDEALADFNNDGLSEISIGRIPARTGDLVTTMLTKTQQWEASNNISRGALFAADVFDAQNHYDFEAYSMQIAAQLPAGMPWTTAFRSAPNPKVNLIAGLNTSKYIANYSGHGTTGVWAASTYFETTDVPTLNSTTQPTIYTMLTCLNGYFINPATSSDSLSEWLVQTPGKGAVATWSSSGKTTPDVQLEMAKKFYNDIGTMPATSRIGDLIKDAKTHVSGGTDVRLSWVLLGDPMLRMHPDPPPFAAIGKKVK